MSAGSLENSALLLLAAVVELLVDSFFLSLPHPATTRRAAIVAATIVACLGNSCIGESFRRVSDRHVGPMLFGLHPRYTPTTLPFTTVAATRSLDNSSSTAAIGVCRRHKSAASPGLIWRTTWGASARPRKRARADGRSTASSGP